jgi:hypothetical protein
VRGFLKLLALSTASLIATSQSLHADNFLDRCFPKTTFLKTKIECRLIDESGELKFTMNQSKTISIVGTGRYGSVNKNFNIEKITHLPPRLSDVGALDESVRFLGTSLIGSYVTTIDIPCNQTSYGAVGLSKKIDGDDVPAEHIAACFVQ